MARACQNHLLANGQGQNRGSTLNLSEPDLDSEFKAMVGLNLGSGSVFK